MTRDLRTIRQLLSVSAVALFLAVLPVWPYGYYVLLRLLVCGASAYLAYIAGSSQTLTRNRVLLLLIAVLFNPLVPVHLLRSIWAPIDLGVGLYLLHISRRLRLE